MRPVTAQDNVFAKNATKEIDVTFAWMVTSSKGTFVFVSYIQSHRYPSCFKMMNVFYKQ